MKQKFKRQDAIHAAMKNAGYKRLERYLGSSKIIMKSKDLYYVITSKGALRSGSTYKRTYPVPAYAKTRWIFEGYKILEKKCQSK